MRNPTAEQQETFDQLERAFAELLMIDTRRMDRQDHLDWATEALGVLSNTIGTIAECATSLDDELEIGNGLTFMQKCIDQHIALAEAKR